MEPERRSVEPAPAAGISAEQLRAIRRQGRRLGLVLLGCAVLLAGVEWWTLRSENSFSPKAIIVGTFALLFGAAALIEPRLVWAGGRERHLAPRALRVATIFVAVAAVGVGIALAEWLGG
jgi:hypothetical protein